MSAENPEQPDVPLPERLPPGKPAPGGRNPGGRFLKGFDPRRNTKPPPPGPGRPKSEFLERMRRLAASNIPEEILADLTPDARAKLLQDHPLTWLEVEKLRLAAWREVSDRGHGRATVPVSVDYDGAERARLRSLSDDELVAAYLATLDAGVPDDEGEASATEEPGEEPKQLGEGDDASD